MTLQAVASRLPRLILDFLLPPLCPVTGAKVAEPGLLSPEAWAQLRFIEKPWCPSCGAPQHFTIPGDDIELQCSVCLAEQPEFDCARSVWTYNDVSSRLIMRFKHGDQLQLTRTFVPALKRALQSMPAHPSLVIPVPLHRWRLFRRQYNQAALLAKGLAESVSGLTYAPLSLIRTRATKSQGHMNSADRAKNVKNAFRVPPSDVSSVNGKNVLLVDDVYTTGATIRACAKALKAAGAARVDVLTVARVVREA